MPETTKPETWPQAAQNVAHVLTGGIVPPAQAEERAPVYPLKWENWPADGILARIKLVDATGFPWGSVKTANGVEPWFAYPFFVKRKGGSRLKITAPRKFATLHGAKSYVERETKKFAR